MPDSPSDSQPGQDVVNHLLDQLRRHPKRVVFTEGEDLRVIEAASRLVTEEVVAPVLLGNREKIRAMAAGAGIPLKFVHIIDPPLSSDFKLFCQRVENMDRYRSQQRGAAEEIVARPQYFGSLMVQYGQADAVIGGNQVTPATFFRALLHTIKPLQHVPKIFGVSILIGPHLKFLGGSGILFLADTAMIPQPEVNELSSIAVETGKLAHHFLGRRPLVAMLSHSTKGSSSTPDAQRVAAATALAQSEVLKNYFEIDIEGEVQADVALDPEAAESKLSRTAKRATADVLVFPNLDAAHISLKLLRHVAGAQVYGKLIMGLARPAAQVARTASTETIFGTAAAIAVEAIKFHQLYPDPEL